MKKNLSIILYLIVSIQSVDGLNVFREMEYNRSERGYHFQNIHELKTIENQLQRSVIDIHGNRVRSEEYARLSQPNVIEVLALTKRKDRVDSVRGTFTFANNIDVSKLEIGYQNGYSLWTIAKIGILNYELLLWHASILKHSPDISITSVEIIYSNGIDELKEIAKGGHPLVPRGGSYPAQTALFNYYARYVNGKEKLVGHRIDDTAINSINWSVEVKTSYHVPLGSQPTHEWARMDYPDGTFEQWDVYTINRYGEIISTWDVFRGKYNPFDINYEYIITASEFGERTIDMVGFESPQLCAFGKVFNAEDFGWNWGGVLGPVRFFYY